MDERGLNDRLKAILCNKDPGRKVFQKVRRPLPLIIRLD